MSNPHANHQGELGDTGTGDEVERLAEIMWRAASRSGDSIVVSQRALHVMARAVIASAPTPPDRVGEEVGRASHLWGKTYDQIASEILTASRTGEASALVARLIADARAFERDAIASAPSPDPAGAGGDLGELERLSAAASQGDIVAEPYTDDHGGCYLMAGEIQIAAGLTVEDGAYLAALARDHRSGKLVASTGSGEETKGACLTAPGSCPSGPTAPRSSGFAAAIPSRDALHQLCWSEMPKYGLMSFKQLSEAVSEVMVADRHYKRALPLTECFIGHEVVSINFNSLNRIVTTFVQAALALGTEAEGQDAEGSLVHEGPAPEGATP